MKLTAIIGLTLAIGAWMAPANNSFAGGKEVHGRSVYDFTVQDIDGKEIPLSRFKGKVLLIVNVASKCGLTAGNYAGMTEVHSKYKEKGLEILAFPANNFGGQEPGSNSEIKEFCGDKGVKFPVFAKVSVKGDDQCPLYRFLTNHPDESIAGEVAWNFQKYLVDRNGKVIAKFGPRTKPTDKELIDAIEVALAG